MRKAVSLVCIRNKSLLIVCDDDRLTWTVPGGKPELNETDIVCLQREVREELSADVSGIVFYKRFEGISPHQGDRIEVSCYFGNIETEPSPSSEITAIAWEKDFRGKKISNVTQKIIDALRQDGLI